MACKTPRNTKSKCLVATLVTENRAPCVFCQRLADDELIYGKLYAIGDIQCHYFCVLLSCCLIQKGKDEEGLFGFLYADILAEVERSKKHRCSFCGKGGATLGCSVSQCRKQFHLPCGRERNAVSLFYGNYKSFCELHAPKQKIPDHIMANARVRKKQAKSRSSLQDPKAPQKLSCLKELYESPTKDDAATDASDVESVCVICYEEVEGFPTTRTFWPPCCARDAWFHRACLQRMALSAGMHYLKCPLCNDKENFYEAVVSQGYYVPDRDAAWELEQNAFAGIYERPLVCGADECLCPRGRNHDAETGEWDIKLCLLCGTSGRHAGCGGLAGGAGGAGGAGRFVCGACAPAAPPPEAMQALQARLEAVILAEQAQSAQNEERRPVMPSRMSLRRTKQRPAQPSSSRAANNPVKTKSVASAQKTDTESSRLELNLKTPKRHSISQNTAQKPIFEPTVLKDIENKLLSPLKLVEQGLHERIKGLGVKEMEIDSVKVLERVREKFKKPRPLSVKKKIVDNILESLLDNVVKNNPKTKEAIKEWSSPKKTIDDLSSVQDSSQENNDPTYKSTLSKDSNATKQSPKRSPLSLKRRTPIKFKIRTKSTTENSPLNVFDNDNTEDIDKVILSQETTPTKSTKEVSKNTTTLTKEFINQEDSTSKTVDKGDESVKATPQKEDESKEINNKEDCIDTEVSINDDSSNSTFVLPAEFVADCNSDESLSLLETPKKLKNVDIQKDSSLEICENDEVVNVNHIKIEQNAEKSDFLKNLNLISPVKPKKCAYKFSSKDKETLEEENMNIDLESFKNYYLNEVGREFKCNFGHKHKIKEEKDGQTPTKLRTAIDFALEAYKRENRTERENNLKKNSCVEDEVPPKIKKEKRKATETEVPTKKRKKEQRIKQHPKIKLVYNSKAKRKQDARKKKKNTSVGNKIQKENSNTNIQVVCASNTGGEEKNITKSIDLTIEASPNQNNKTIKKNKHKKSLKQNIRVKIRFKEEQVRLKITESQRKKPKNKKREKLLQQYVLKYCSSGKTESVNSPKTVIVKPERPLTPIKRKYNLKQDKSPDNLIQTSIQSFFKAKPSG